MKVFVAFLLALIILAGGAFWGYQILTKRQETTVGSTPFSNPFTSKPSSSFGSASTEATNPFAEPTGENPFGSSESQSYQNPFEALR